MLRALILGALLALVTSRANARLWETISQTEARYGHALQTFPGDAPGEEQRKYRYKDFYILVAFLDGRSDGEWYVHVDGKTPFSDREIPLSQHDFWWKALEEVERRERCVVTRRIEPRELESSRGLLPGTPWHDDSRT